MSAASGSRVARVTAYVVAAALITACAPAPSGPDSAPSADRSPRPSHHHSAHPTPTPTPTRTDSAGSSAGDRVLRLLGRVPTTSFRPYHPGYDRSCFAGHACVFGQEWTDDHPGPFGHNGCDTRQDVLLRQMRDIEMRWGSDCRIYEAALTDPYTGERLTWRDDGYWIQIDHVYPLAEAWHAGAWAWPESQRLRFANDVRRNLLAVTSRANNAKGSATPSDWLPPNRGYRCTYVTKYLKVAVAYDLSITEADAATIRRVAQDC